MVEISEFREGIRILVRKLGLLNKTANGCNGISLSQCHAMIEIGRYPGISLKELAIRLNTDVSTTSRTVDGLVKKGLAVRTSSVADRRYIDITLSDEGMKLFHSTEESMHYYYTDALRRIPTEKQDQVLESLGLLINAFSKESEEL